MPGFPGDPAHRPGALRGEKRSRLSRPAPQRGGRSHGTVPSHAASTLIVAHAARTEQAQVSGLRARSVRHGIHLSPSSSPGSVTLGRVAPSPERATLRRLPTSRRCLPSPKVGSVVLPAPRDRDRPRPGPACTGRRSGRQVRAARSRGHHPHLSSLAAGFGAAASVRNGAGTELRHRGAALIVEKLVSRDQRVRLDEDLHRRELDAADDARNRAATLDRGRRICVTQRGFRVRRSTS